MNNWQIPQILTDPFPRVINPCFLISLPKSQFSVNHLANVPLPTKLDILHLLCGNRKACFHFPLVSYLCIQPKWQVPGHLPYTHTEMMGTLQESVGAALVLENVGLISSHGKPESKLVRKPTSMSFGHLSLEDIPSQTLLEVWMNCLWPIWILGWVT